MKYGLTSNIALATLAIPLTFQLALASVPDAPAAAFARAGDGLVEASWLAPIVEPATPIESYTAT